MEEKETGNPVFDYRASFRAKAGKLQRLLIVGGLALFVICGGTWLAGCCQAVTGVSSLVGVLTCLLGIGWGFYWRNKIRTEFRGLVKPQMNADKRG